MASSIGEAKKFISDAAEQAVQAQKAADSASGAVEEARTFFKKAAEDSGHAQVQEAMKAYDKAIETLAEAKKQIADAQAAADSYADTLG